MWYTQSGYALASKPEKNQPIQKIEKLRGVDHPLQQHK